MPESKLLAQLPKSDTNRNGLDAIAADLVEHPGRQYVIVALVDSPEMTVKHGVGIVPHIRVLHVEAMTDTGMAERAWYLLDSQYGRRANALPMEFRDGMVGGWMIEQDIKQGVSLKDLSGVLLSGRTARDVGFRTPPAQKEPYPLDDDGGLVQTQIDLNELAGGED